MQMEMIFSNMMQATSHFMSTATEILKWCVNDAYFDMFGYHDTDRVHKEIEGSIDHVDRERFMDTFAQVVENQSTAECEVKRFLESGGEIWIKLRLKYINRVGERHIILGALMISRSSGRWTMSCKVPSCTDGRRGKRENHACRG